MPRCMRPAMGVHSAVRLDSSEMKRTYGMLEAHWHSMTFGPCRNLLVQVMMTRGGLVPTATRPFALRLVYRCVKYEGDVRCENNEMQMTGCPCEQG